MMARSLGAVRSPRVRPMVNSKSSLAHTRAASLPPLQARMHTQQHGLSGLDPCKRISAYYLISSTRSTALQSAIGNSKASMTHEARCRSRSHVGQVIKRANTYGIQLKADLKDEEATSACDGIEALIMAAKKSIGLKDMPFVPEIGVYDGEERIEFEEWCNISRAARYDPPFWACIPCDTPEIVEQIRELPEVDHIEVQGDIYAPGAKPLDSVDARGQRSTDALTAEPFTLCQANDDTKRCPGVMWGPYESESADGDIDRTLASKDEHAFLRELSNSERERGDLVWWLVELDMSGAPSPAAAKRDLLKFRKELESVTIFEFWALKDPQNPRLLDELFAKRLEDIHRSAHGREWYHGHLLIRAPREDCEVVRKVLQDFVFRVSYLDQKSERELEQWAWMEEEFNIKAEIDRTD